MKIHLALLAALLGHTTGESPELNPKSFDDAIHSGKNVFVKFYAPVSAWTAHNVASIIQLYSTARLPLFSLHQSGVVIARRLRLIGIN